jgi:hypothetical protein
MAKFHLLYHIYPRPVPRLIFNLERILRARRLFDGQMLFSVAQGESDLVPLDWIETYVRRRLADHRPEHLEFFPTANSGSEALALFDTLLPRVASQGDEFTFFAHTKGTSPQRCDSPWVLLWTHWLYEHCLLPREQLLQVLPYYAAAGCFRIRRHPPGQSQSAWHYSGTFFWLNHARVFSRNWQPQRRDRYAGEAWLGTFLPQEESYCFFGDGQGILYNRRSVARVQPDRQARNRELDALQREIDSYSFALGDLLKKAA